ncbi:MAG: hypothetical protein K2L70_05830 [Clostridia bacterium]|nr:hypothetical protein [Clostridia bacterium]
MPYKKAYKVCDICLYRALLIKYAQIKAFNIKIMPKIMPRMAYIANANG